MSTCLVINFQPVGGGMVRCWARPALQSSDAGPSREILRQRRGELLQRPVDLVAGDHQRRGDADRVLVGILGEDALALERLAVAACAAGLGAQPRRPPQAAPAYPAGRV